ncbi:hypothetical protein SLEP1_g29887 [Rubroshorea leprosula]|uniref:DNA-directed RNA polymerase III subunit RPC9 n=1 Tax=Rubroshorea leprosula TaxID=152421 RepID=A0AAV5JYD1_9ROSI|nr:hypothetical protein SLEP1_g29887 [Rubroshorea leprosula]
MYIRSVKKTQHSFNQHRQLIYDYLVETAACNQTREHINEFLEKCKKYGLAKAEVLDIINLRPSSLVEIEPVDLLLCFCLSIVELIYIIEQSVKRFKEHFKKCFEEQLKELLDLVAEVLPAAPTQQKPEEEIEEENEEMADGEITENERQAAEAQQITQG